MHKPIQIPWNLLKSALNLNKNFNRACKKAFSCILLMNHLIPHLILKASLTVCTFVIVPLLTYCAQSMQKSDSKAQILRKQNFSNHQGIEFKWKKNQTNI